MKNLHIRILILLVAITTCGTAQAQKMFALIKDSVPLFRSITVMGDVVGAAQMQLSDYGQWEGAVRVNLHDQWLPVLELGYGKAKHENDEMTGISYKTEAPFFRVGCDFNILKQKHSPYLLYVGLRYGFTAYKYSLDRQPYEDPIWQWETSYSVADEKASQHWVELTFGLDARVFGPVRMGWSARWRRRLHHSHVVTDNTWYVPGYGTSGSSKLAPMFYIGIEL